MKRIALVGLIVVMAGCSSHPVKCHGRLRPINKPTAGASTEDAHPGPKPTVNAVAPKPVMGANNAPSAVSPEQQP